jgi:4-carboxymuconolactone decarboxylase
MFGGFAPELVGVTDEVLFGRVGDGTSSRRRNAGWSRVACLVTSGSFEQLAYHPGLARQNSATWAELIEAITYVAVYAGRPKAMFAMAVAETAFGTGTGSVS